jgi:hypothetical protein
MTLLFLHQRIEATINHHDGWEIADRHNLTSFDVFFILNDSPTADTTVESRLGQVAHSQSSVILL